MRAIAFSVMSQEQFSSLLAKLKQDARLLEKLKSATSLDSALAMVQEDGFDISKADWLRHQEKHNTELKDEVLAAVAGGGKETMDDEMWGL